MLAPATAALGACTDPKYLPLVDAAFEPQGKPARRRLEREVCPGCPIRQECLHAGLENGEHGTWGGTDRRARNKVAPRSKTFNMRNVQHPGSGNEAHTLPPPSDRQPDRRIARLEELGITTRDVKAWAVTQGLLSKVTKGRAAGPLIEAYAAAHAGT